MKKLPDTELYFSCDIEADGPIPGPHSMLSLGCAAFTSDKTLVDTFSANLQTLPGASGAPDTMKWWESQPVAWARCRVDLRDPEEAVREFAGWVEQTAANVGKKPVFVGYPAGYDFTFVYWYLIKFAGRSPFGWSALDVKSFAMAKLGYAFRDSTKKSFPKRWMAKSAHSHVAVEDAVEQGEIFVNMLNDTEGK